MHLRFVIHAVVLPVLCVAADRGTLAEAQAELFAARYEHAVTLFSALAAKEDAPSEVYCGLVAADLRAYRAHDAYQAADEAVRRAPGTVCAETAAGLVSFRRGDINKAEQHFRAALRIDPKHPMALMGLSRIYSAVSLRKTAQNVALQAWQMTPEDPQSAMVHARSLKGVERIGALERVLAGLDPESDAAKSLRASISFDRAVGDRRLDELASRYERARIKLFTLATGGAGKRAVGLTARLNSKQNVTLLLDTGATGVSLNSKLRSASACCGQVMRFRKSKESETAKRNNLRAIWPTRFVLAMWSITPCR